MDITADAKFKYQPGDLVRTKNCPQDLVIRECFTEERTKNPAYVCRNQEYQLMDIWEVELE